MKIVLDTNIILSAFLTQGASWRVVEKCLEEHEIYVSEWIIKEVKEKLEKKFKVGRRDIEETLQFIRSAFLVVNPKGKAPKISRDKDDNNLLWLADFVSAKVLITGDSDLLILKRYKNTKILNPKNFHQKYLL